MKIQPKSNKFKQNKKKQQFLNNHGVRVKVDGSWGPWQEKQYQRLINKPKGFWNTLKDMALTAAYNDNPAFMAATGWTPKESGGANQDSFNTPERNKLANNLATIGELGITLPTIGNDVITTYNILRHPIQNTKKLYNIGKDLYWFTRHPKAIKVYHGSLQNFNLKDARTASRNNIGIHVTPNKNISKVFSKQNGNIIEAYIPRHNAETIDIGANNYNLLSNNYIFDIYRTYDAAGNPKLFTDLLNKYGANPIKIGDQIHISKRVNIPLRNETFPKLVSNNKADRIIQEGSKFEFNKPPEYFKQKAIRLNQEANDLLSNSGYKVIKYNNVNPMEVGATDGTSYIVTDPSVFYNPTSTIKQRFQSFNFLKYPFIYENEK